MILLLAVPVGVAALGGAAASIETYRRTRLKRRNTNLAGPPMRPDRKSFLAFSDDKVLALGPATTEEIVNDAWEKSIEESVEDIRKLISAEVRRPQTSATSTVTWSHPIAPRPTYVIPDTVEECDRRAIESHDPHEVSLLLARKWELVKEELESPFVANTLEEMAQRMRTTMRREWNSPDPLTYTASTPSPTPVEAVNE